MSAFLVTKKHIDYLVNAARVWSGGDMSCYLPRVLNSADLHTLGLQRAYRQYVTACDVGRLLWKENLISVAHRYGDNAAGFAGNTVDVEGYKFIGLSAAARPAPDPVVVIKSLQCLEYQSCEHDGWKTSAAKHFCDELLHEAIKHLPGYDKAPWGIE